MVLLLQLPLVFQRRPAYRRPAPRLPRLNSRPERRMCARRGRRRLPSGEQREAGSVAVAKHLEAELSVGFMTRSMRIAGQGERGVEV